MDFNISRPSELERPCAVAASGANYLLETILCWATIYGGGLTSGATAGEFICAAAFRLHTTPLRDGKIYDARRTLWCITANCYRGRPMKTLPLVRPTAEQLPLIGQNRLGVEVIRGAAGSGKTSTAILRLRSRYLLCLKSAEPETMTIDPSM